MWNIATGQQLASIQVHAVKGCNNLVYCLAVPPHGRSFISGSHDGSLKLWRFTEMFQQPSVKFCIMNSVRACVVSAGGDRLYSGGTDKSIHVWDMTTGQELVNMQSHTDTVTSLALSGSLLASGSYDKTVKLWDTGSMQLLRTLQHYDKVCSVAVFCSGSLRVLSSGGDTFGAKDYSIRVWDAASGTQLALLEGHSYVVCGIAVTDGSFAGAASASCDKTICVWELASLSLRATLRGHHGYVRALTFL